MDQTVEGSGTVTKLKTWPGGLKIKQTKLWSAAVSIFLFLLRGMWFKRRIAEGCGGRIDHRIA